MQFDAALTGDAATLARQHADTLRRLPPTVHAFVLVELQRWPVLFAAEQRYQRVLLEHLAAIPLTALQEKAAGILRVENEAGLGSLSRREPARFQDEAQSLLRRRGLIARWRSEVDAFFQQVDPAVQSELHPPDGPRRLVVQLYGSGIAVQPGKLWERFKGTGTRIPLALGDNRASGPFLRALFGGADAAAAGPALFNAVRESQNLNPLDAWIVESHEGLHDFWKQAPAAGGSTGGVTGLSYDRLLPYRDALMRALYDKILTGVESPQAFAAYARSLKLAPDPGVLITPAAVVQTFTREVLLTGNGTLFVNNTFVEWASVQALRRAQPRMLVARFGVRDKLKPFSSLLLFSQPRASDQIPLIEDPVGSFVDVEQLSYYVWLNAEKSPAYRNRTLYLFLAEGIDEMLAIRSDKPAPADPAPQRASLPDVCATMAAWLGVRPREGWGRPIGALMDGV